MQYTTKITRISQRDVRIRSFFSGPCSYVTTYPSSEIDGSALWQAAVDRGLPEAFCQTFSRPSHIFRLVIHFCPHGWYPKVCVSTWSIEEIVALLSSN